MYLHGKSVVVITAFSDLEKAVHLWGSSIKQIRVLFCIGGLI
jgi:hypothetical protein